MHLSPFLLIFGKLYDLITKTLCKEYIMKDWHKAKLTTNLFQWSLFQNTK